MADVTDVTSMLVGIISGLIYPNGTSNPSVGGVDAKVFAGWPIPETLKADLANDVVQVSVYTLPSERNTTRYLEQWQTAVINTPTLTLFAAGQTVTVGGTIPPKSNPHNAVIFVNQFPYVYAVQPTDNLNIIATALTALIAAAVPGTMNAGAVITLPAGARLGPVRIGVTGTSVMEISRQEKQFQLIVWANTPANRTSIAKTIDSALRAMTFILLPDFTFGRLRYMGNRETDSAQKQQLYRRDLIYTVEYATTQLQTNTQITQEVINVSAAIAGVLPAQPVTTVYL